MKTTISRTTQKQNNISTGNKDSVNEYFTLKQCADYLQVNPATVRNWTKLNKIGADAYNGRQPLFLCHKIEAFKSALLNNNISSLKSRRNKSYKKNSELYSAYLKKDSKNTAFCNNLIKFVSDNQLYSLKSIRFILSECIVRIFFQLKGISYKTTDCQLNHFLTSKSKSENQTMYYLVSDLLKDNLINNTLQIDKHYSEKNYNNDKLLNNNLQNDKHHPQGNYFDDQLLNNNRQIDTHHSGKNFTDDKYNCMGNMGFYDDYLSSNLSTIIEQLFSEDITADLDEDLAGLLYLSIRSIGNRKKQGAYFTPLSLARTLNKTVFENYAHKSPDKNIKILDPACGSGSFLLTLPKQISFDNIYGYDIDDISISIIRINFYMRNMNLTYDELCMHFECKDYLTSNPNFKFDYIIGNPPWGSSLDSTYVDSLKPYLTCATAKGTESFSLFIEHSAHLLNHGGQICFIVPKSIFIVKTHQNICNIMLKLGKLNYIKDLSEAFKNVNCPGIFFVWKKSNNANIQNNTNDTHDTLNYIEQNPIRIEADNCIFITEKTRSFTPDFMPVFINNEKYSRLMKLLGKTNCYYLKNNAEFGLGIVTGNNKEFISDIQDTKKTMMPILKGTDISRYNIKAPSNYIEFIPAKLQQCAPLSKYQSEKIVYRFINKRLTFALDTTGCLTLNSCNFLIPKIPGLDIRYILAVLNSSAAQFIFENRFSSIKVLRSHIEQIPIPAAPPDKMQQIINLTEQISNCENAAEFAKYDRQIDELVWECEA